MNKDKAIAAFTAAAKEFRNLYFEQNKSAHYSDFSDDDFTIQFMAQFLQSMIDQGKVVSPENWTIINGKASPVDNKWRDNLSTVSSAGKEVKTVQEDVIDNYYKESQMPISLADIANEDVIPLDDCVKLMNLHANQFKSSPAITEQPNQQVGEVTDKELQQYFHNHTDCFADSEGNIYPIPAMTYNQIVKLAKWLIQFNPTAKPVKEISEKNFKPEFGEFQDVEAYLLNIGHENHVSTFDDKLVDLNCIIGEYIYQSQLKK